MLLRNIISVAWYVTATAAALIANPKPVVGPILGSILDHVIDVKDVPELTKPILEILQIACKHISPVESGIKQGTIQLGREIDAVVQDPVTGAKVAKGLNEAISPILEAVKARVAVSEARIPAVSHFDRAAALISSRKLLTEYKSPPQ
ncbi:hypothetical protein TWF694_001379 [Orbilia ellipsospora]|uniref:Uncharacterized protein n=1 Tax=Orbilia ellipsospora TaxID=2528407 RepID=A0AAV9XRN4_9PEZI